MTRGRFQLLAGLVFLAAAVPLLAQTFHGGLRGAVREPGGVIPGVSVTLTNEATNVARTTTTNQVGEYAFVNVDPGTYTTMVSMQGFKTIESKRIRIGTQQFVTLDFTLEVGGLQDAITVEGQASPLETSNASVASSLDEATLQTLPTAGRNPFFLAVTTASVVPTGDPQFVRQQDQTNSSLLSLGGGPRRGNNYTLDGVSIVDMRNRATIIPSIEAVEEVKVQVSTYDAEMGRTGGGVFNMTGRSGTNEWRGSLLGQTRPRWGAGKFFFNKNDPKPDTYFYLYGGSFGGPIVKNKTFFWGTAEGYKTKTSRNAVVTAPTQREISGDFSQSGVTTIYDPLTTRPGPGGTFIRDPFPGNVIPSNRISPVARALQQGWPQSGGSAAELIDEAITGTLKLDHTWSDKVRSSLMYGYYDSVEPESRFYGKPGGGLSPANKIGENPYDPAEGALYRTVHVVALNNTFTPNQTTVGHVRVGYTTFVDDCVPNEFDPGTLGFSSAFIGQIPAGVKKFPQIDIGDYGTTGRRTFGDRTPQDTKYYAWEANASVSKLVDRHTLKVGASYRKIGMENTSFGALTGSFSHNGQFTRANPIGGTTALQHSLADFLLGFPSGGNIVAATANDFYIDYYAGYVQDDFRVNSKLTLNLGLRYEFEQGLKERNNAFTVGFDRDRPYPVQVPGLNLRGGLMYAGVDGYPDHQSDPGKKKFAPRAGFAWKLTPETVVRGGYGLYWSPNQYAFPTENRLGTRGFTEITDYVATTDGLTPCAGCSIVNPFPNGIRQPGGSAGGLTTGAGGTVNFVDQFRKSPYIHQFSVDLQREMRGGVVVGLGYVGSRTERISIGGTNSEVVNINQLDPRHLSLGTALLDQVPNPMFGNTAAFGQFGRQATIRRGQLLRPYPQFGDVLAHQVSEGKARYHSVVARLERRIRNGWGGRINYTWSSNKDNIFGEANFYSGNTSRALNNYDFDAEYSDSLLHTPHRLNVAVTAELPFGKGKRWLSEQSVARVLFGGWSIAVVGAYQSGFPSAIVQNTFNAFAGFGGVQVQRPNLTGTDPATSGGSADRVNNWFNPAAWSQAPDYTFGNAPRTDSRVRTPFKDNTDIAFQKVEPLGGRRQVMVRLELINAFDDANFRGPNVSFGGPLFGRITAVGGFPRTVQLTFRFGF